MAAGCQLRLCSTRAGMRTVAMDHSFYTGYRKNILAPDEVLVALILPYTKEDEHFVAYKQAREDSFRQVVSRRRDDDIAIVNSAFFFKLDKSTEIIDEVRMAFGGMAPTTTMAQKTMDFLKGKLWSTETIDEACDKLLEDLPLPASVPGGMVRYRQSLAISFLFKAFLTVSKKSGISPVPEEFHSATEVFKKAPLKSHQLYEIRPLSSNVAPVGRPLAHKSAEKQSTGEAQYVDDMPRFENEAYMGLVLSTRAHAEIVSIDASKAIEMDGVYGFMSAEDLPDNMNNYAATYANDEEVFAKGKVRTVGQLIAGVLAASQAIAQRAAKLVNVEYKDLPAIISIEDAIAANSYFPAKMSSIKKGDMEATIASSDHIIKGMTRNGAQEHFYLETNAFVAVPNNEEEWK